MPYGSQFREILIPQSIGYFCPFSTKLSSSLFVIFFLSTAPVLKGRPRKKKKLSAAQNSVLKKKRFVADIQNHLVSSPATKRCKMSEEDESASSDMSEGVLERIKVPPQAAKAAESNGPPPLVKPKVQISPKAAAPNVPVSNSKVPPPLISTNSIKDVRCSAQLSQKQASVKVEECSRTMPMQKQIHSMDSKLRKLEKANNNNNNILLVKSPLADNIQSGRNGKILNLSAESKEPTQQQAEKNVTNTQGIGHTRTVTAAKATTLSPATSTRPVATTQGTVGTQLAASTSPGVRSQPVASLPQPVTSVQAIAPKPQQFVTPMAVSTSSAGKPIDGVNTGGPLAVRSKPSKENEERPLKPLVPVCVSEEKKENELDQSEEHVVWKKKKKRLRMPGSVKDEVGTVNLFCINFTSS